MLRPTLTASALAALLLATACDQNPSQRAQNNQPTDQQQAMRDTTPTAPPATEPAPAPPPETTASSQRPSATRHRPFARRSGPGPASAVGNELAQATGTKTTITKEELAKGQKLTDVANPGTTLANAAVKTMAGEPVGEVRSVVVGKSGKADAVIVEVGGFLNFGERAVELKPNKFTYLPERNILVTEVTKAELEKMPVAKEPATTP